MPVRKYWRKFPDSLRQMKSLRAQVAVAMLIALQLAVKQVASIQVSQSMRISFDYLVHVVISALYGPAAGVLSGAVTDVLGHFIKPTGPYFPGFTVSAMLGGAIYGLAFYHEEPHWLRVLLAQGLICLMVNTALNTLWISMLYGSSYAVILPARALKNLIQFVPDAILLTALVYLLLPRVKALARLE